MNNSIRKHIDIISEVQSADHSEYDDIIQSQFPPERAPRFLDTTQGSIDMFLNAYPDAEKYTKKSDSGNFYVQWLENDDVVAIVGIVSETGRMERKDYSDFLEFVDMLLEKLQNGKKVMTSPNRKSLLLINKIKKMAERARDMTLHINSTALGSVLGGDPSDPELDFHQVVITAS